MSWYDEWFGTDWGATDWTKDEDLAHARYSEHILDMQTKKGWPGPMVTYLIAQSQITADESGDGEAYWKAIGENEPDWIVEANVNPADLAKIDSHVAFLESAGAAADAWNEAMETYSPTEFLKEVIKETAEDVKEEAEKAVNPFRSWIPWAVGGALVGLFLLKK